MRERPIIMDAASVRAILNGRKMMTRRVVKFPVKLKYLECSLSYIEKDEPAVIDNCPYGHIGDRLWVRETWAKATPYQEAVYKSTYKFPQDFKREWKSPTCMPRWASRILLEITNIRVERLQDISEEDAEKEGFVSSARKVFIEGHEDYYGLYATDKFMKSWRNLNAKRGFPWELNPWVWVIEFKVVEAKSENEES